MSQAPVRNFKKVFNGGNFLKPKKWDQWSPGDFIEGTFLGSKETDLYGKPIYEIKVEDSKFTGASPLITTGERAGIVPLYPNGALMAQMSEAVEGDFVRITYNGMAVASGKKDPRWKGKPCHDITVEIDGYVPEGEEESDGLLG